MSVFRKLFTAVKGHAHNAAEEIQDRNLIVILEQELRDARNAIDEASREKAKMAGRLKLTENKIDEINKSIADYKTTAAKAKGQNDMDLAREIMSSVIEMQDRLNEQEAQRAQLTRTVDLMSERTGAAKDKIKRLEMQIESAKATESVIRAQKAASTSSLASNGALAGASDSLRRLEKRQAEEQAVLEAAQREADIDDGTDLKRRMDRLNAGDRDIDKMLEEL